MEFKELKEIYINICKDNDACSSETKRVHNSKNKKELLQVVKDNDVWCKNNNAITVELLDAFGEDLCKGMGIYYKGVEKEITDKKDLLFLGNFKCEMFDNSTVTKMFDNSTVTKMWNNSTVTEMFDNSTVTKMFDNSTVTEMLGNSTVTEMWGNSTVTKMWNNSTVTKMFDNSTVTKMFDNSTVTEMLGNSTVTKMWGNSTVTKMFDNSTVKIYGNPERVKGQNNHSQIIDFKNKKIYVVKSKFEIVEI